MPLLQAPSQPPPRTFTALNLGLISSAALQAFFLYQAASAGVDMNAPDPMWAILHWSVMLTGVMK